MAIFRLGELKNLMDVQNLVGCIAAPSHFISHLGEKASPFYWLLEKSDKFVWTNEAQTALDELKWLLSSNPILVAPKYTEPMLLYISAATQVISIILAGEQEEDGQGQNVQCPVYYACEVLSPSK